MNTQYDLKGLIGLKIEAIIGEPWDFTSEAGEGALLGKIVDALVIKTDGEEWIICEVTPFKDKEKTISRVAAKKRYYSKKSLSEELMTEENVGVNLKYSFEPTGITAGIIENAIKNKQALPFLIGSIRLKAN